jgi:hypothetical protein
MDMQHDNQLGSGLNYITYLIRNKCGNRLITAKVAVTAHSTLASTLDFLLFIRPLSEMRSSDWAVNEDWSRDLTRLNAKE